MTCRVMCVCVCVLQSALQSIHAGDSPVSGSQVRTKYLCVSLCVCVCVCVTHYLQLVSPMYLACQELFHRSTRNAAHTHTHTHTHMRTHAHIHTQTRTHQHTSHIQRAAQTRNWNAFNTVEVLFRQADGRSCSVRLLQSAETVCDRDKVGILHIQARSMHTQACVGRICHNQRGLCACNARCLLVESLAVCWPWWGELLPYLVHQAFHCR